MARGLFMIVVIFVVALGLRVLLRWMRGPSRRVTPLVCPSCRSDGGKDTFGKRQRWYRRTAPDRIECRACFVGFRERRSGALVEDRD